MPRAKKSLLTVFNRNLDKVQPSAIRAFDNEVSGIPDILKLTLGEPDFNVPEHIKQAAKQSITQDDSHYAASNGTLALRQAGRDRWRNKHTHRDAGQNMMRQLKSSLQLAQQRPFIPC